MAIAIDGPVASGKSVVGRRVAERLGYRFLDTGWMYRAITWAALHRRLDISDESALTDLANQAKLRLIPGEGNGDRLVLDGQDITDRLRDPDVERAVSPVSKVPGVRRALVTLQKTIAGQGPIVMVGRDIGTVVLPDARLKVFLDASLEVRARRRHAEVKQKGISFQRVLAELGRRDKIDTERSESPLRQAEDAVRINTDNLGIDDLVERIVSLAEAR